MSNREYEIVVQNSHINMNEMKKKIKKLGAKLVQKETLFYYIVYTHPLKKKNYFIRIRFEGKNYTMTVKHYTNKNYPLEYEIIINNLEQGNKILLNLGCEKKYEIHKLRETWKIKGCHEIVFDTYPGAETYAEIECDNLKNIQNVLKKLGLSTDLKKYPRLFMGQYYLDIYGIQKLKLNKDLTFKSAYKILYKKATKNKSLLKKRLDCVNKKHKKEINTLKKK